MTQILDGKIVANEMSKNAKGGTELIIDRMLKFIPPELFNGYQIIHSRIPDELSNDHKVILVFHDLPNDPMYQKLRNYDYRSKIYKYVFVSNWQMQQFINVFNIPYSQCVVIRNGIEVKPEVKKQDDCVNIIYHTTPHRGLELLIPAYKWVLEQEKLKHIHVHLDVYSSFKVYGWDKQDEHFKDLFDECKNHPHITYHGAVSNDKVREALKKSHIFAYPCIWQETSCLSAIEAMADGNIVVTNNFGALPETCANFALMYQYTENKQEHLDRFSTYLADAIIKVYNGTFNDMSFQSIYFNVFYNFEKWIGPQWVELLSNK